jgi:hypothetical protein
MAVRTIVTMARGHGYSHPGVPNEDELRHPASEVEAKCRTCGSPQLVANVTVNASR